MIWNILGIGPTNDKKAITAAYRQRLVNTNPEEKPEEFKALRNAYEEALRYAEQPDSAEVRDTSPVGLWMERVAQLYQNFPARIRPEAWEALLGDAVCIALDTRPLAEEALLRFLMENYYLPRTVWEALDRTFRFTERIEELYEVWPREFIDYAVLNGIRMEERLPYDLFIPGENASDCDSYRRIYYQATQLPPAELKNILEQMDALSERHPYGDALKYRFWMETGKEAEGKLGLKSLVQAYPDNTSLCCSWASVCLEEGDAQQAETLVRDVLQKKPGDYSAKTLLVQALEQQKNFTEAKELVYEILHDSAGDPVISEHYRVKLQSWNEILIQELENALRTDPGNSENAIDLAWCYIQNEHFHRAMEIASAIQPETADPFAYHNLIGKLNLNLENVPLALEHLQIVEEILRNMEPDGTEKTRKRIERLPEILSIVGSCLAQEGDIPGALEKYQEALVFSPEDAEVLSTIGRMLFSIGDYEGAAEILERMTQASSGSWHGYLLMALALYRLHRDRDAYDAINRAISINGGDLTAYIVKMQVLMRNEVWDEVREILQYLEENNAPQDMGTDWIRAQLVECQDKDSQKALTHYRAIAAQMEAEESSFIFAPDLYYHMATIQGENTDVTVAENADALIALLDKGLIHDERNTDCLTYKGWLLKRSGRREEALALFHRMEEMKNHPVSTEYNLAEIYYSDLQRYAKEALFYYEKLLTQRQTTELYFYAANCKRQLGDYSGAWKLYSAEMELDPEDVDAYNGLAFLCDAESRYAESINYLDQAIAIMERQDKAYLWLIEHKVQTLRRLGDHAAALSTVDAMMEHYDYPEGYKLKFEICCQFGLWEQAKQVLIQWKDKYREDPDLAEATGKLHAYTGKLFQASLAMGKAKRKLTFEQVQDFRIMLADLECNQSRLVQLWTQNANDDPRSDYALMNLAEACMRNGDQESAVLYAQRALELLDDTLKLNLTAEALYRSRRSIVLAILGRTDEAREELARTRALPLCQHCPYGSCKDADLFEANIEEFAGNGKKALELYRAGRENWPDDTDFIAGEARIMKRGGKGC